MIGLFTYCLLGPISSWVILSVRSLIFSGPLVWEKIEVLSLALKHIIKPNEPQFPLPVDWQSPIGRLCSDQADSCFIFGITVVSSFYSASSFADVTGLVMCSIWKDHFMASIFVLTVSSSHRLAVFESIPFFSLINSDCVLNLIVCFFIFLCRFLYSVSMYLEENMTVPWSFFNPIKIFHILFWLVVTSIL
jgi:hypothetical protein